MDSQLKAAKAIVKHLENDLEMAKTHLQSDGHDDKEALLIELEKALGTARNVLRGIERNVRQV